MGLGAGLGDLAGAKPNGTVSGTTTPLLQQVSQGLAQGLSSRRGSPSWTLLLGGEWPTGVAVRPASTPRFHASR